MTIAFYAPMKPPDHPVPSGDREVARLLMEAIARAGYSVELACRLASRVGDGDLIRQERLQVLGQALARLLVARYQRRPAAKRPRAWFTYHLYYKAADWVGPAVCKGLAIPYLVAEASVAPKRAGGPWDLGHRTILQALDQAAAIISFNPSDQECLPVGATAHLLRPFLDTRPYAAAAAASETHRATLAERYRLDVQQPWLLAVGMMRQGDKLASYRVLAEALCQVLDHPWELVVVGDGPARNDVEASFDGILSDRLRFVGAQEPEILPVFYAACDLLLWPAINEAYGMALLEAQATSLPVIAGASGGVPWIVRQERTGLLAQPGDVAAFASAVEALLKDPAMRANMADAAGKVAAAEHSIDGAAAALAPILGSVAGKS